MIVVNDRFIVNPALVSSIFYEESTYARGEFCVKLFGIGNSGKVQIGSKLCKNMAEAELFMDYCCKEIDMANGVYNENNKITENNID